MTEHQLDEGLDELIAEMNELHADFEEAAQENWAKRQEAEKPNAEEEGDETEEGAEGGEDESEPEREFQAELFLLVPHYGQQHRRPLPRRPAIEPRRVGSSPVSESAPIDSSGVEVTRNGQPTDKIETGKSYRVQATVRNLGGVGTSTLNVELFTKHERPDATLDTNPQSELELSYSSQNSDDWDYTGFTTVPPDGRLVTVFFVGSSLQWDNMLHSTLGSPLNDRTFQVGYDSKSNQFAITGRQYNSNTFTVRMYDVSRVSQTIPVSPQNKQEAKTLVGILTGPTAPKLFETTGRWVQGTSNNNQVEPMNLSSTVNGATLEGRTQTSIPANGTTTVTFGYTAPSSRNDRTLTELYVRAYSLAPTDTPQDWNALNHTTSRFVGRTELYWPVGTVNIS